MEILRWFTRSPSLRQATFATRSNLQAYSPNPWNSARSKYRVFVTSRQAPLISTARHFNSGASSGSPGFIENNTLARRDLEFLFESSTRFLTSERSERMRCRVDLEPRNSVSLSNRLFVCLLYKHLSDKTRNYLGAVRQGLIHVSKRERVAIDMSAADWLSRTRVEKLLT